MIIAYNGWEPAIAEDAFIAPNATIVGNVEVQSGVSVLFGAVLRGDHGRVVVGEGSNVQDNAVLHAPGGGLTLIGKNVVIGHGAMVEGCQIGDRAVIGMNAVVLKNAVVGEWTMLAAGSVVPEGQEIPARVMAAGVPAQVKKELGDETQAWMEVAAEAYHEFRDSYRAMGLDARETT